MTKAQLDMIHKLISDLAIYAEAAGQYGNGGMVAVMRNASAMLQIALDEAEAKEKADG
jgi:hypothetical protein